MTPSATSHAAPATDAAIRAYWDERIHDTQLCPDPPGSLAFFSSLDAYRYGRLDYLPRLIRFDEWRDRDVLDIGCGAGLDLVRFARAGARACGVELSRQALVLASQYVTVARQQAALVQADAGRLPFRDESFDLVFCHGVLPFARDCAAIVAEAWRVLRYGGTAVIMVYNRRSWLYAMRALRAVGLGHDDAPVFRTHTRKELEALLAPFTERRVVGERLPAPTRLHTGLKAALFNGVLVRGSRFLPERWLRPFGWHLVALCTKQRTASERPTDSAAIGTVEL